MRVHRLQILLAFVQNVFNGWIWFQTVFIGIHAQTAAHLVKTESDAENQSFSVFLISGVYLNAR